MASITFLTDFHRNTIKDIEENLLTYIKYFFLIILDVLLFDCWNGRYGDAFEENVKILLYIQQVLMIGVNIYDFTNTGNYLWSREYQCFLQQPHVRKALHLGNAKLHDGDFVFENMKLAVMKEGI